MRKLLLLVALTVGAAVLPVAASAADSLDAVHADIAKLTADVNTKHDTVVADATKLETDAKSLVGTTDRHAAHATIKADATKLTGDWKSLLAACRADRTQLRMDVNAARGADKSAKRDLRLLVRETNLTIRATNLEMRAAVARARAAVFALRASFRAAGEQAPAVETPPASTP